MKDDYINPGYKVGIRPIYSSGTNSTMFTDCCGVAICEDQAKCPVCDKEVIGCDAETPHERGRIRWDYAYQGKGDNQ